MLEFAKVGAMLAGFIMVAIIVADIPVRGFTNPWPMKVNALLAILGVVAAFFFGLSWMSGGDWKDAILMIAYLLLALVWFVLSLAKRTA